MESSQFPFRNQFNWQGRKFIGEGGFSKIYKVQNMNNNQYYAIKQIDMTKIDSENKLQGLRSQISLLMECKGPNIVDIFSFHIGNSYTYLVLQLCEIDLREILLNFGFVTQKQAIKMIRDVVSGYKLFHKNKYIHRDIKPQNILLKQNTYKITDFGFAKKLIFAPQKLAQMCGTPLYMSPQLLLFGQQSSSKCDVWSLGILLYEAIFGYTVWSIKSIEVYKRDVFRRGVVFPYGCGIGQNVKDFIQRCLVIQEANRISMEELFNHPLIVEGNPGPPLVHKQISQKAIKVLSRIQQSSDKKFINVKELFKKYSNYTKMDKKMFYVFLRQIDPQVTTYESTSLFQILDLQGDGFIDFYQFKSMFLDVDYQPRDDLAIKRINQLAKMAQARNFSIKQLFDLFDLNKNSQIDFNQFSAFVLYIAPKLSKRQVEDMFKRFDKDNSKTIRMNQFVQQFAKGTNLSKSIQKVQFQFLQRARRNVQCLSYHFRQNSIIPQNVINNKINQNKLDIEQFQKIVSSINYYISRDQIIEMFRLIDQNNSEQIQVQQLYKLMDMQIC